MAKAYKLLQSWNHWLRQPKGKELLTAEEKLLNTVPEFLRHGKFGLMVGVPEQESLFKSINVSNQVILTPFIQTVSTSYLVESDHQALPVASGSADLVILPHSFEYSHSPRRLITEACRVVKPMGHIIVLGFHPLSLKGIKKILMRDSSFPLRANFIFPHRIKHWLGLSDFVLVKSHSLKLFKNFYILVAEARATPATPIRFQWTQKLPAFRNTLVVPLIRKEGFIR